MTVRCNFFIFYFYFLLWLPGGSGAHDLVPQVFYFSFWFFIAITRAVGPWSSWPCATRTPECTAFAWPLREARGSCKNARFFCRKKRMWPWRGAVSRVCLCVCASVSPVCLSYACLCLGVRFEGLPWPVGAGKVAGPCPLSSKCHIYMCLRMYVRIHSYIRM